MSSSKIVTRPNVPLPTSKKAWSDVVASVKPFEVPEGFAANKAQQAAILSVISDSTGRFDGAKEAHGIVTARALALLPLGRRTEAATLAGVSQSRISQLVLVGTFLLRYGMPEGMTLSSVDRGITAKMSATRKAIETGDKAIATGAVQEALAADKAAAAERLAAKQAKLAAPPVEEAPASEGNGAPVIPDRKAIVKAFLSGADALIPLLGALSDRERHQVEAVCTRLAFGLSSTRTPDETTLGEVAQVRTVRAS